MAQSRKSDKMPVASTNASDARVVADDGAVVQNSGIFRSSNALLAVSSLALIAVVLLGAASHRDRASNLKELSDTVLDLTQKLQVISKENERKEREIVILQKEYEDKKIELSWENQHVHDEVERHEEMYRYMVKELVGNQDILYKNSKVASQFELENNEMMMSLETEHDDNAKLKVAYAFALAELEKARRGGGDKDTNVRHRKLRGVNHYQPGDSIEILESDRGGMMNLWPGIVHSLNTNGTYDLVNLGHSIILNNMESTQVRTYQTYLEGTQALFLDRKNVYLPITIVRSVPNSAEKGFELHGKYEYRVDGDESMEIKECMAVRVHRLVEVEDIVEYTETQVRDLLSKIERWRSATDDTN
mmetsp:Transcript_37135/g.89567  ORF Transcript_37135/g.89567 Transcript_37135/m.89567 type:complete len:361 (-) Transcript_37135:350-1432(-)